MASGIPVNPLVWWQRAEQRVWRLLAEVEYRLKIVPRGTLLRPSVFDQRMLRLVLAGMPILVGTLFVPSPTRTRLLLLLFLVVVVVLAVIFAADARAGMRTPPGTPPGTAGRRSPPTPRPPAPPPTRRR
jgi:hypothetical protein